MIIKLKINKTHLFLSTIVLALLSLFCYWTHDELLYEYGLISVVPLLICLVLISITIFQSFILKFYPPIFIGLIVLIPIVSAFFASQLLFKASLRDDLSGIELILRRNQRFEISDTSPFGSNEHGGNYKVVKNKIILQNRSEKDNEFIPDTLTVYKNKLIMYYDNNGNSDTSFARYFEIERNKLYSK